MATPTGLGRKALPSTVQNYLRPIAHLRPSRLLADACYFWVCLLRGS